MINFKEKKQLGVSLVEMLVVLGLTAAIVLAFADMMQLQSISDKRDDLEFSVADLKKNLISNIDCQATFENFSGTCDGTQAVMLYKTDILGSRPLTGALIANSNSDFKGSGAYSGFYVKSVCGAKNTLLIDVAIPAKFNPPVGFKNDPNSLQNTNGSKYLKKLDFKHPLLNGLLSLSDGFCSVVEKEANVATDGYSRVSTTNQALSPSVGTFRTDQARTPIFSSSYTAKGEKLSIHFQSHFLSGTDDHKIASENIRMNSAKLTAFMRVTANGVTMVNEPVASFDFFEGTVRSRMDIERQVDTQPGDIINTTIEMQVTNFGVLPKLPIEDIAFISNSRGFMTIEDYEK
ncbi:MAG: hypothetical protein KBD78_04870 [Oligoflexales bacterium]|nr:hypothetical protein [Oligoflexales bacterium]